MTSEPQALIPRTERVNPLTADIDTWETERILHTMNLEDHRVAPAVATQIPAIARAVEMAVSAISRGGRLFYVGSGTSGRLAVLDASEVEPTFGVPRDRIIPVISGGYEAIGRAREEAEDDEEGGARAIQAYEVGCRDCVMGIAASGRTPFVAGALRAARQAGASTVAIVGDPEGQVAAWAEVVITPWVGPEVVAGSTRLKNGTAQKLILNMISTATMIRLGRTYSNLMAGTAPKNQKLSRRVVRILMDATGCTSEEAQDALDKAHGRTDVALVMLKRGVGPDEAQELLHRHNGSIRKAVSGCNPESNQDMLPERRCQAAGPSMASPANVPQARTGNSDLRFGAPEEAGLDPLRVEAAFSAVQKAVGSGEGELPGAVLAIIRKGVIIGPRAYGLAVRNPERIPATPHTMFDLASLTKVVATTPSILRLCECGELRLDDPVCLFIPEFAEKGKEAVTIRQILTHTAGLPAHVRFWEMGLKGQEILRAICQMELENEPGRQIVYSDIGFILLGEIVSRVTGMRLDEFARREIFSPMGMTDTCFSPDPSLRYRIAATEYRCDLGKVMWGEVHDENAYALGGIAGHAGLFSTIFDLCRYATMWLRQGSYGGKTILSRATCVLATREHARDAGDRRGLGWQLGKPSSSAGDLLSERAFGHTGFTGTSLWCDPELDLAVILLTNRVHAGRHTNPTIRLRALVANAAAAAVIE